jgi:5'-nucleotidase / UDP-sugar diphosphatase
MRLDDVIPAGPISNYQLESIFLFADETRIVTFPLSGSRLREVLERGVSDASFGKGGFLQAAGVEFTFDRSRPSGSRLVSDLRRPDGGLIGPADTVKVAMAAFPACEGGDGYKIPEAVGGCGQASSGPRAADLLVRYLADSLGGKITVPASGRIVEARGSKPG